MNVALVESSKQFTPESFHNLGRTVLGDSEGFGT